MGTKNKPCEFDCYAAADPDEPMFILLGRDRHAPVLVRLWALLRERDGEEDAKIAEALQCAETMDAWATQQQKPILNVDASQAVARLYLAATQGLSEHPFESEMWDDACDCEECRSYD